MKLSFVIPAYNEEHSIGTCLSAIAREARSGRFNLEIIVVNNASTDHTREAALKHPGVRVVDEPRKGIVWARRAGFLASTGDLIANVDADDLLTPGWIQTVFDTFSKDPNLLALSGPLVYYDLSKSVQFLEKIFYFVGYLIHLVNQAFHRGAMIQGGNYVVRRSAIEAIGGYDTSIQFYGEDTDIARRVGSIGKVKFTFALPMLTSGRRLANEGVFTIGLRYALNYFWVLLLGKPWTHRSADIRPGAKNGKNIFKEIAIGMLAILIIAMMLAIIALVLYFLAEFALVLARLVFLR